MPVHGGQCGSCQVGAAGECRWDVRGCRLFSAPARAAPVRLWCRRHSRHATVPRVTPGSAHASAGHRWAQSPSAHPANRGTGCCCPGCAPLCPTPARARACIETTAGAARWPVRHVAAPLAALRFASPVQPGRRANLQADGPGSPLPPQWSGLAQAVLAEPLRPVGAMTGAFQRGSCVKSPCSHHQSRLQVCCRCAIR